MLVIFSHMNVFWAKLLWAAYNTHSFRLTKTEGMYETLDSIRDETRNMNYTASSLVTLHLKKDADHFLRDCSYMLCVA